MTAVLRTIAVLIAVAAIVDPAFAVRRPQPTVVDVRIGARHTADASAIDIRRRILDGAGGGGWAGPASAVVLVGPASAALDDLPEGVPVSLVELDRPADGSVRLVGVSPPAVVLPGQTARVTAEVEAFGLAGQTSVVALEQQGVELARATIRWTGNGERQRAEFAYAPPSAGIHHVRIVAHAAGRTSGQVQDAIDVALIARSRELRVLTYEPRPSWSVAFVRRALETDPAFAPAALARASRGIDVRAGAPPPRLTAVSLAPYHAVIAGAPEALSVAEIEALEIFARMRGGAVLLLPDRRPTGPYATWLPVSRFDELLVEAPQLLEGVPGAGLTATELALPRNLGPGADVIASTQVQGRARPVIVSWPLGAGRLVFSGALDAWRYRADGPAAFARFWRGQVANLAASAPRALDVTAAPALAAPGDRVMVRAMLRQTEWAQAGEKTELPAIGAMLVAADGTHQPIRLWPTAETGLFEGTVIAEQAGRFDVHVSAGALSADTPVIVADGIRASTDATDDRLHLLSRASGGVAVSAADLAPLDRHLRGLSPPDTTATARPMRSAWWLLAFVGALSAEWTLRRRRGEF